MEDMEMHKFVLPYLTGKLSDFYSIGKEIGRGHFGVVRECRCLFTGNEYACKSVDKLKLKTTAQVNELQTEITAMKELGSHPGIVQIQQEFEDERYVHIVMEKCDGGDLYEYIRSRRRLSEFEAAAILKQIVEALGYCHSKGVLHRDIKPENIFISSRSMYPTVKIGDFGLAVRLSPGQTSTGVVGSIYYMAPEVLRKSRYDFPADVWSLGIVLFAALCGFLPFWGKDHEEACMAILKAEIDFSKLSCNSLTCQARDLISSMLCLDTSKRLSLNEILLHPWLSLFPQLTLYSAAQNHTLGISKDMNHNRFGNVPSVKGPKSAANLHFNGNSSNVHLKSLKPVFRPPIMFTQDELSYLKTIIQTPQGNSGTKSDDKLSSLNLNSSPKSVMEGSIDLYE